VAFNHVGSLWLMGILLLLLIFFLIRWHLGSRTRRKRHMTCSAMLLRMGSTSWTRQKQWVSFSLQNYYCIMVNEFTFKRTASYYRIMVNEFTIKRIASFNAYLICNVTEGLVPLIIGMGMLSCFEINWCHSRTNVISHLLHF